MNKQFSLYGADDKEQRERERKTSKLLKNSFIKSTALALLVEWSGERVRETFCSIYLATIATA
jgi:hypothetical protein